MVCPPSLFIFNDKIAQDDIRHRPLYREIYFHVSGIYTMIERWLLLAWPCRFMYPSTTKIIISSMFSCEHASTYSFTVAMLFHFLPPFPFYAYFVSDFWLEQSSMSWYAKSNYSYFFRLFFIWDSWQWVLSWHGFGLTPLLVTFVMN